MNETLDVVVVGGGTAGAAAAGMLARRGRRVALLEDRPLSQAGARWVVDVPPWMFDEAGVERPLPPEKLCDHLPLRMLDDHDQIHLRLERRPMWGVDGRLLGRRLLDDARAAGVTVHGQASLLSVERDGPRPRAVRVRLDGHGKERTLAARPFVDASGSRQALLRQVPALARDCPPLEDRDLCHAVQQVCQVADAGRAKAYLEQLGAGPDQVLIWPAVDGGFSTWMLHVERDLATASLLTGVVNRPGAPGEALMRQRAARLGWVGPRVFGGGKLIPLRRPYDRLAGPGLALVGDAACMALPAHGSGVGAGLMAARLLADAVAGADDPGAERTTWRYQREFQRRRGGVHAAYDVFRRLLQSLRSPEILALLRAGAIAPGPSRAALEQRMLAPAAGDLLQVLRGAAHEPLLSARLAPALLRMQAVHQVYRRYPEAPGRAGLRRWSRLAAAAAGQRPDL